MLEAEGRAGQSSTTEFTIGPITKHICESISYAFPDEKVVEDCNTFIRDSQREQRHKVMPMFSIYERVLKSGSLSSRGFAEPHVPFVEVAGVKSFKNFGYKQQKIFQTYCKTQGTWPRMLDRILLPRRDWPAHHQGAM